MEGRVENLMTVLLIISTCWQQVQLNFITIDYTGTTSVRLTVTLQTGAVDQMKLSVTDANNIKQWPLLSSVDNTITVSGLLLKTCYHFSYDMGAGQTDLAASACTYVLIPSNIATTTLDLAVDDTIVNTVTALTATYRPSHESSDLTGNGAVSITLNNLNPGEKVAVTVVATLTDSTVLEDLAGEFCSMPEPVQYVALVADSETTTALWLTIAPTNVSNANQDSEFTIVPTCNTVEEARQILTCDPGNFQCLVSGLKAGCRYTLDVQMECDATDTDAVYSNVVTQTFCTKPEPVSHIALTPFTVSKTAVSLTVFPTATIGANSDSVVTVVPTCGSIEESRQTPPCTNNVCALKNLRAGCPYSFSVQMACDSTENEVGGEVYSIGVSKIFCTSPEPVESVDLVADSETTSSLTLTITPTTVANANEGSNFTVLPTCNYIAEARQILTCDSENNQCSVNNLKAGCQYTFDVQMRCDPTDADAVYSNAVTQTFCTKPEPVSHIALTPFAVSKTGVSLTVSPTDTIGANSDSVVTVIATCGGIEESRRSPTCIGNICPLTSLKPGCSYSFSVQMACDSTENEVGGEVYSIGVYKNFCTTPEPVESVDLVADSETTSSLTLTITPTTVANANEGSNFTVLPTCNYIAEARQILTCDSENNQCSVNNLKAGCQYTFDVQMRCDPRDADAVYSNVVTQTFCTKPEPLSDIALTPFAVSKTGVSLTVSPTATIGANSDSVVTVIATCGGIEEYRRSPTCIGNICPLTSLRPGCPYSFSVQMACDSTENDVGGEVYSIGVHKNFCTIPEPVANVDLDAHSETTSSLTLTIVPTTAANANEGSVFTVLPTCNDIEEPRQILTCDPDNNQCAVTNLKAGCHYTLDVQMECNPADADAVYSTTVTKKFCTKPEPVSAVQLKIGSVTTTEATLIIYLTVVADANADSTVTVVPICNDAVSPRASPTCGTKVDHDCELSELTPGCKYTFEVQMECDSDSLDGDAVYSTAVTTTVCTKPLPLSSATLVNGSTTVDGLTLTLNPPAQAGVNPDSSVTILPKCENTISETVIQNCNAGSNCVITGLETAGCLYTFDISLRCSVDGGNSIDSDLISPTFCSKPQDLAEGVSISSATSYSITFNGLKVSSGKGVLHATATSSTPNCNDKNGHIVNSDPLPSTGDGNTATVTGLMPGCPYLVTLRSACAAADGTTVLATSDSSYQITQCTIPAQITASTFNYQTTDSLTLTGITLENAGSHFSIQASATAGCTSDDSGNLEAHSVPHTALPYTFNSLIPGCLYTFTLAAQCTTGGDTESGTTNEFNICTKPEEPTLGAISNIQMTSFDIASVSVPENTYANSYKIAARCGDCEREIDVESSDATTTISLAGLTAGCNHTITTVAQCRDGGNIDAESEKHIQYQCTRPNAFTGFDITQTSTSLHVAYIVPPAEYQTFSIEVKSTDESDSFNRIVAGLAKTVATFDITGLSPVTQYDVTLKPFCGEITGDGLTKSRIITRPVGVDMSLTGMTTTSCTIRITLPVDDGDITKYKIAFKQGSRNYGAFGPLKTSETFSNLVPSNDYTFSAKYQYTPAEGDAVESEPTTILCRAVLSVNYYEKPINNDRVTFANSQSQSNIKIETSVLFIKRLSN